MILDARTPGGPITDKWDRRKFENKLVNPANRRKFEVIVVGTGTGRCVGRVVAERAGLQRQGVLHRQPRRAHSIAAQGGINAAKNYRNDGDSVYRLFYDTIKGGDYRAREANVYRLAQMSVNIIDSAWHRACPSRASMAGCSTTARSAARRCHERSMRADRRASSCCSAPTVADAPGRQDRDAVRAPRNARP